MTSLFRKLFPTWSKTLSQEIAKLAITALLGAIGVWCAYLVPPARSWLGTPVTTSFGALTLAALALVILGGGLMVLFLRRRINELAALAATDDLTKSLNSREVKRRLAQEVSRSKRQNTQFCFILIDIDSLKATNDTYGYGAGDDLLREFAQLAKSKLRLPDVFGRYRQGDEFAILALDTDSVGARIITERLRSEIAGYHFYAAAKRLNFKITFSAGVAAFDNAKDSIDTIEKHAELALGAAKRTKNSVAIYDASLKSDTRKSTSVLCEPTET